MEKTTIYDNTEQRIIDFKVGIAKKDRDVENMCIDSLIWYVEAAMSYSYCHPGF